MYFDEWSRRNFIDISSFTRTKLTQKAHSTLRNFNNFMWKNNTKPKLKNEIIQKKKKKKSRSNKRAHTQMTAVTHQLSTS